MKFLVVGLGSMGKRRIRNLIRLGNHEIIGFDVRSDRCNDARDKYGIRTFESIENCFTSDKYDALIISTPPKFHFHYAKKALELGYSCFIEASVIDQDKFAELEKISKSRGLIVAPSCTMKFFPGPKLIKEWVLSKKIGKILYFSYHTGQFLEDWHPWESIHDFYVTDPETSACREIVPFELTWINDIFGFPKPINGVIGKISDLETPIDDIYTFSLEYPYKIIGTITIEILSRPISTREMRIVGSEGMIKFSVDSNQVSVVSLQSEGNWLNIDLDVGSREDGYINPEEPYIHELSSFILSLESKRTELFPNSLKEDAKILTLLNEIEKISIKI